MLTVARKVHGRCTRALAVHEMSASLAEAEHNAVTFAPDVTHGTGEPRAGSLQSKGI